MSHVSAREVVEELKQDASGYRKTQTEMECETEPFQQLFNINNF